MGIASLPARCPGASAIDCPSDAALRLSPNYSFLRLIHRYMRGANWAVPGFERPGQLGSCRSGATGRLSSSARFRHADSPPPKPPAGSRQYTKIQNTAPIDKCLRGIQPRKAPPKQRCGILSRTTPSDTYRPRQYISKEPSACVTAWGPSHINGRRQAQLDSIPSAFV